MKKIAAVFIAAALLLTLAGCSDTAGKLNKIKKSGTLTVYTKADFPPFEFSSGETVIGVDMEIAKEIAKEIGVNKQIKKLETNLEFKKILDMVSAGKCDMAISGITITDERKKLVDFSHPYIESVQYLILPDSSNIAFFEDLAGKRVGVASGWVSAEILDDEIAEDGVLYNKGCEKKEYGNAQDAVRNMLSGNNDAVISDKLLAEKMAAENQGVKAIKLIYKDGSDIFEEYGVAVAKGNQELLDIINTVIDRLVAEGKIAEWVLSFS